MGAHKLRPEEFSKHKPVDIYATVSLFRIRFLQIHTVRCFDSCWYRNNAQNEKVWSICVFCLQSIFCQLSVSSELVCNAYGLTKNLSFSLSIQVKCINFLAQRGGWYLPLVFHSSVELSVCLWLLTYPENAGCLRLRAFFGSTGKCISKLQEGYYLKNQLYNLCWTQWHCVKHTGDTNVWWGLPSF